MRDKVEACIRMLNDLLEEMGQNEPVFPDFAKDLVSKGICLNCKRPIGKMAENRGCHFNCARKIQREIANGNITEHKAIEAGILAPKAPPGRPKSTNDGLSELLDAYQAQESAGRPSPSALASELVKKAAKLTEEKKKALDSAKKKKAHQ